MLMSHQSVVYLRHLEWYLDGTSGRSTSRLQKRFVTMGVANTLRNVEAKSVRAGELSGREWSDLLAAYMKFQRACDPLCTTGTWPAARPRRPRRPNSAHVHPLSSPARRFTLVPIRIAAMVAQDEGNPCCYTIIAHRRRLNHTSGIKKKKKEALCLP